MRTPTIRTIAIGSGAKQIETVGGQVFAVIASTGTFTVQADQGSPIPMTKGRGFGQPGSGDFSRLVFVDTSGATNTITFYAGDEPFSGADQLMTVSFGAGSEVALDAATIAALIAGLNPVALDSASLLSITPAQQTLTPDFYDVTTDNVSLVAKKAVRLENVGAADATITIGGGTPRTLASGRSVEWSAWRHQDKLATIEIDAAGTTVQVTELA